MLNKHSFIKRRKVEKGLRARLRSSHVLTFPLNASVFTENCHLILYTTWREEYRSKIRKQLFLGIFQ